MTSSEFIEAVYTTWGSYGQYYRRLLILRNGQLIDPAAIYSRRGDSYKTNKFGVEVEILDSSSRKNKHIYVRVPREEVLAIVEDGATSSGWKGFTLYGPGEIVGIVSEETKEYPERNRRVMRAFILYVYRHENIEIELQRRLLEEKEELIGKPRVIVKDKTSEIEVLGDTYHIRDLLKSWGFRWDPVAKRWYRQSLSTNRLTEFLSALKEVAEVTFIEEKGGIATTDELAKDWNRW